MPVALDVPATPDGKPIYSSWPTEGSETMVITHDWTDRTTWYGEAESVTDEVATCQNPGTYTLYAVAQDNLIDTYHGKIYDENTLGKRVTVKVNGTAKTEQDPHTASGGDYTINYSTGVVTFLQPLTSEDTVTVSYHYENGSTFTIAPASGKVLKLVKAEIQFSTDITMNDSIRFTVFAGPYQVRQKVYKTMRDLYSEAQGTYPQLPAAGGTGWRGLNVGIVTLPFIYMAVTDLADSDSLRIDVDLEHDTPFSGTYATATFYCLSQDEVDE